MPAVISFLCFCSLLFLEKFVFQNSFLASPDHLQGLFVVFLFQIWICWLANQSRFYAIQIWIQIFTMPMHTTDPVGQNTTQNTTFSWRLSYFLTSKSCDFRNPKGTPYSRHWCNERCAKVGCHNCSWKPQLNFDVFIWLGGQKFEKL